MESYYSSSSYEKMERSYFVVVATQDHHFHHIIASQQELKFMSYLGKVSSTARSTPCRGLGIHGSCPRWYILVVVILFMVLALATHLTLQGTGMWKDGRAIFIARNSNSALLLAVCAPVVVLLTLAVALFLWKCSPRKIMGGVIVFLPCAVLALVALTYKIGLVPSLSIMLPSLPLTYLFRKFCRRGNRGFVQRSRWAREGAALEPELDLSI